jgi:hypothetical protein
MFSLLFIPIAQSQYYLTTSAPKREKMLVYLNQGRGSFFCASQPRSYPLRRFYIEHTGQNIKGDHLYKVTFFQWNDIKKTSETNLKNFDIRYTFKNPIIASKRVQSPNILFRTDYGAGTEDYIELRFLGRNQWDQTFINCQAKGVISKKINSNKVSRIGFHTKKATPYFTEEYYLADKPDAWNDTDEWIEWEDNWKEWDDIYKDWDSYGRSWDQW